MKWINDIEPYRTILAIELVVLIIFIVLLYSFPVIHGNGIINTILLTTLMNSIVLPVWLLIAVLEIIGTRLLDLFYQRNQIAVSYLAFSSFLIIFDLIISGSEFDYMRKEQELWIDIVEIICYKSLLFILYSYLVRHRNEE